MSKTKEQIRLEIVSGLHQQSVQLLVESLAEAQVRIEELSAKVAELEKAK